MALEKARLINTVTGEEVPVLFNPAEYTVEKGNQYAEVAIPGLEAPLLQFSRGNARTLAMELFLDTSESGRDVREFSRKITSLLDIEPETHAPPVCRFIWGGGDSFTGVLERASQRFTMFLADGRPVRATVGVTLREFLTTLAEQERPRQSPDRTKLRTITEGDSLWLLAAREYGDASQWRHIARASGIVNPRLLTAGSAAVIPPIE